MHSIEEPRAFTVYAREKSLLKFMFESCGFAEHADVNAARNIATRGVASWAVSHAADDAA
ncbi:hypothetical protein [Nonomuraea sp. NPDC049141]|uniref:hypothetical protein n=1 Tax=unclassified Nonomuraea TaxID=2593643 RepID=UPI0033E8BD72